MHICTRINAVYHIYRLEWGYTRTNPHSLKLVVHTSNNYLTVIFELQESKFLLKNDRALFAFLQITSVCLLNFDR